MTIRRRLTIAIAAVLLITLVMLGVAVVRTTRATLVNQLDTQLENFGDKSAKNKNDDQGQGQGPQGGEPETMSYSLPWPGDPTPIPSETSEDQSSEYDFYYRQFFEFECTTDGVQLRQEYAGTYDDPKVAPIIPKPDTQAFEDLTSHRQIVTLESADGEFHYRILVIPRGDEYFFVGLSMESVDEAVAEVIRNMIIAALGALVIAAGVCWYLIWRGLTPVNRMVDTAARVAGGDLSSRVPNPDPNTELGKLGMALNDMMTHIETADADRSAGEQRLRRFVADAAHELRTPLTSVRGYAELFRAGALPDSGAVTQAMGRIESEGERMARLVDDLLLLARLDQQRGIEQEPVDLAGIVNDAVMDFRVIEPDRTVNANVSPKAMVRGDRLRLRQVIDNLLTNVRTHTPAGTAVDISLKEAGDSEVLEVRDYGPGISEEDRERVFERFWRADPARTRSKGGTGLGLAIVASLVEAHHGNVEIEGEPGKGTTFRVSLPSMAV